MEIQTLDLPFVRLKTLTPSQHRILLAVQAYMNKHGYAPSVREIGAAVGLSSPSTVHESLRILERKGYIVYEGVRRIRVLVPIKEDTP